VKHKLSIFTTLVAVVLISLQSPLLAQELPSLSLEDQWTIALKNSYDMVKAQNDLRLAAEELDIQWWDDADIGLSSSTSYDIDEEDSSTSVTLDASVGLTSTFDVGTTLSAKVTDDELSTSLYATYKPFAQDDVTPQMVESYERAKLDVEYARRDLKIDLETAYLNLIVAQQEYAVSELELEISEQALTSIRAAFDLGESSSTELIDAQKDTINTREDLFSAMVDLAEAEQTYQELLGNNVDTNVSNDIDYESLSALIDQRQEIIEIFNDEEAQSETQRTLAVELISLKEQLDDIYDYDPDLTFKTTYDIEDNDATGIISINLSPDQFGDDDQYDAQMEIKLKEIEITNEERTLAVQLQVYRKKIEIAAAALESNTRALEQEQINTKEAQYMYEVGKRTKVELAQQNLAMSLSEVTTFISLVELYQAQSDLATLFK
jgi:outer membrane protein TolC